MRTYIITFLLILILIASCTTNPKNTTTIDKSELTKIIYEYVSFESFWSGRWSKLGYWGYDAYKDICYSSDVLVKYIYEEQTNYYKVFIPKIRSLLYLEKVNNSLFVISADDSWWKESDQKDYYYTMNKECGNNCVEQKLDFIELGEDLKTSEVKNSITESDVKQIVNATLRDDEERKFLLELKQKFNVEKMVVKAGKGDLLYPCIYYYIKGLPYIGYVIYDPDNNSIVSSDFFYWKEMPDKKHYLNIIHNIDIKSIVFVMKVD